MQTIYVAKIVIINSQKKILSLRRSSSHPELAGRFDLPGGRVEGNESMTDAVIREAKEETGIDIAKTRPEMLFTTSFVRDFKGLQKNFVRFLYVMELKAEVEVKLSFEHDQYEWLSLEEVLAQNEPGSWVDGIKYIFDNGLVS